MQLNKQLIAIIILLALLLSSIGAALYFYKKNQRTLQEKSELVTVYIAKEDIPKDTLITIDHLAQTQIAKQFILNDPLIKEEIVGKYTNEKIYTHEIFLKQKLDTQIVKEEKKLIPFEKSAYNMKFELFKNPNYALNQGEYINIASVYPVGDTDNKGRYLDFDVTYVAPKIKILGFIRDGRYESATITKQKVKKVENKQVVEVIEEVKSDEIILDIDMDVLLNLIKNYNLGTQLWMTRTSEPTQEEKSANIKVNKSEEKEEEILTKKVEIKPIEPRKYLYKLYTPTATTQKRSAIIDYANNDTESKEKNVEIVVNSSKLCSVIKDKYIIGSMPRFYIRSEATTNSSGKALLDKNTIIPYIAKINDWYKTCDEQYIHQSVVNEATADFVNSKLGKYE